MYSVVIFFRECEYNVDIYGQQRPGTFNPSMDK